MSVDTTRAARRADMAMDLTTNVRHPSWCTGRCTVTVANDGTREVAHESCDVTLQLDEDTTVQVSLMRLDYWAADGTGEAPGETDIVVNQSEAVLGFSPAAARTLGRALIALAGDAR